MRDYEFRVYPEGGEEANSESGMYRSDSSARAHAGTLAKRFNGPVDLATNEAGLWEDRYMTTASPSEFHVTGYRFERLT